MTIYIALLRGVNLLGTTTLKMADLRSIAEELGFGSPKTFIASGNLLFASDQPAENLRSRLESRLRAHMGREVRVMLRTAAEMEAVSLANPFPDHPGNNVQAFFLDEPPSTDDLATARNVEDERLAAGVREIYVAYGERGIGRSRLRIPAADAGTARNMNTVIRLAQLAREMS